MLSPEDKEALNLDPSYVGPGPVGREAEDAATSGGDELGGGGEQSQPQAAGLPQACSAGQCQVLQCGDPFVRALHHSLT